MTLDEGHKQRLQFLSRVVRREARHLEQTTERLFKEPFTVARVNEMESDDELSERVDAFVSRFSRLQDTLGDKLIPQLLGALGERQLANIDNLDKAERLGWITSADEWMAIRQLRNRMVHEYMEDKDVLVSAIQTAQAFVPRLLDTEQKLQHELSSRGWV